MSDDDDDKSEDAVHRVETIPPPAGEADAYSAATVMRETPEEVIESIRGANLAPASKAARTTSTTPPAGPPAPATGRPHGRVRSVDTDDGGPAAGVLLVLLLVGVTVALVLLAR